MLVIFIENEDLGEIEGRFLSKRDRVVRFKARANVGAVVKLRANPVSMEVFGRLKGRSSAPERIEDDIARIGGNGDRALGNDQFQLVYTGPHFEFLVAVR